MKLLLVLILLGLRQTLQAATISTAIGVRWEIKRLSNSTFQFQVNGPKTIGYAALGIGSGMSGAIMYDDGELSRGRMSNAGQVRQYSP